jgi:hypothetical protein
MRNQYSHCKTNAKKGVRWQIALVLAQREFRPSSEFSERDYLMFPDFYGKKVSTLLSTKLCGGVKNLR